MVETTVLLVRHGHVEGISPPRFRGRSDIGLTPEGEAQAAAVARAIASGPAPAAIYSSPLRRCVMTGTAIADACRLELKLLDSLVDVNYGEWQWKTPEEVHREWPELLDRWYAAPQQVRIPGGDSLQDVALRAADSLRYARERHPDQRIVFVSHDSVIRIMLAQLLGLSLDNFRRIAQEPCALNEVVLGERASVRRVNEVVYGPAS